METQRGRVEEKGFPDREGGEHEAGRQIDGKGGNLNSCLDEKRLFWSRKICLRLDLKKNIPSDLLTGVYHPCLMFKAYH